MLLKIRCSQLHKIMSLPTAKRDRGKLSVGGKTYIEHLAKEFVYRYRSQVKSKYIDKGNECEDDSIMLLNDLAHWKGDFLHYTKNAVRYESDILTGEPDIISIPEKMTRDTKTSWGLDSFPSLVSRAEAKESASDYEWQGRGYMMLLNEHGIEIDKHSVDYCLVDTPDHLIRPFDESVHEFGHIDPRLRVTSVVYERDLEKEAFIRERCEIAQIYYIESINRIYTDHGLPPLDLSEALKC